MKKVIIVRVALVGLSLVTFGSILVVGTIRRRDKMADGPTFTTSTPVWTVLTPGGTVIVNGSTSQPQQDIPTEPKLLPDVHEPKDPPPGVIKVGPFRYHLRFKPKKGMDENNLYGETRLEDQEILLNAGMSPEQLRETVLHELFHAAMSFSERAGANPHTDDQYIESVAPTLVQIMQDNPDLVAWLGKPITKD